MATGRQGRLIVAERAAGGSRRQPGMPSLDADWRQRCSAPVPVWSLVRSRDRPRSGPGPGQPEDGLARPH